MDAKNLPDIFYFVVMTLVVAGWLALIFFPRRPWANFWFSGIVVPQLLCLAYMYFLLSFWFVPPPGRFTDFLTLARVYRMFGNNGLLLVAWINIIAMDLVVGAWMTRKAAQVRMPYVYLLPCLIATFVFAGFGFSMFTLITAVGGRWSKIAALEDVPPTDSAAVSAVPGP